MRRMLDERFDDPRTALGHAAYRPRAPLDDLVEFFWAADSYVARAPRERVLPTGAQALVIHLGESPMRLYVGEHATEFAGASAAIVCGARSNPLVIGTALGPTAGVHFKPGGARRFFDVSADGIAEQVVTLEALWGPTGRALRERLVEAPTHRERVRVLEEALLERARGPRDMSPALRMSLRAFDQPDLASVAEVNRQTGLSPKRLLALF